MGYKIAFDPSIRKIGWCLFKDGQALNNGTLYRPAVIKGLQDSLYWVHNAVELLLVEHMWELDAVAIEAFQEHSKNPTGSLLKLAAAQGVIYGVSRQYTEKVIFCNKGNKGKTDAKTLAHRIGLKTQEDAADAYYIGLLAGFGK